MTTPQPPYPGSDEAWLGDMLTAVLDKARSLLGATAPDRCYVSAGEPVAECNQLTVHADELYASDPLTRPMSVPMASLEYPPVLRLIVTLYRCAPTMSDGNLLPPASLLHANGLALAHEGQALWYGLVAASVDGTLWPKQNCPSVLWRGARQLPTQGNLAGWRVTAEVSLT